MQIKRILIIGAGSAGSMIANEIVSNKKISKKFKIIGFLDDDEKIKKVFNFKVLGKINKAKFIIKKFSINEAIIAIPSAKQSVINKIIESISESGAKIKIIPGLYEIINGDVKLSNVRDFEITDLLGREETDFNILDIAPYFKDATVFVTGAGGSIGSEIVMQLLNLPVKKVVLFGHGENSIHSLINKINEPGKFEFVIGDIKDYGKLKREIKRFKPDMVFHAAAHKHLPLMEAYPDEALKNNVIGTYNLAKIACMENVKRFIFISTDKAVNPTSVMGATKRMSERVILSFDQYKTKTKYSIVRFGNVLGSRGSVLHTFRAQIESGGPITVTHPEITRYFMSIREAAKLVIKAATIETGKIFILDMGKPIKILDLAKKMIKLYGYSFREIKIIYTGLRKGEKLHEELLTDSEILQKTNFKKLFISNERKIGMKKWELDKMIYRIKRTARTFNIIKIKNLIKEYVSEYKNGV